MEIIILLIILAFIYFIYQKRQREKRLQSFMEFSMNLMLEKKHKIEAQGIPYVHNDFEKGVSQMVVFPYKTYEAWLQDYETAVFEIQPHLARKGGEPSMLDFLDDEPCKKAYMHHLDPKVLGQKFGETFNPLDTPFEDGLTPRKAFIK